MIQELLYQCRTFPFGLPPVPFFSFTPHNFLHFGGKENEKKGEKRKNSVATERVLLSAIEVCDDSCDAMIYLSAKVRSLLTQNKSTFYLDISRVYVTKKNNNLACLVSHTDVYSPYECVCHTGDAASYLYTVEYICYIVPTHTKTAVGAGDLPATTAKSCPYGCR